MRIGNGLLSGAALEVGMNHLSDDRTGPNQAHLHHQIIELAGASTGQTGHLRATLDLKNAYRIGACNQGIDRWIIFGKRGHIERLSVVIGHHLAGLFQHRHHSQAEQIDLHNSQIGAVIFVPLNDRATGHGSWLNWHYLVEPTGGNHHSTGMLADVARNVLNRFIQRHQLRDVAITWIKSDTANMLDKGNRFGIGNA